MRTSDLHWLAGLIEGDGYFPRTSRPRPLGGSYVTIGVGLNMTDKDVVDRAARLMGGKVNQETRGRNKTVYTVRVFGPTGYGLLLTLYPLMGERRKARIRSLILEHRNAQRS